MVGAAMTAASPGRPRRASLGRRVREPHCVNHDSTARHDRKTSPQQVRDAGGRCENSGGTQAAGWAKLAVTGGVTFVDPVAACCILRLQRPSTIDQRPTIHVHAPRFTLFRLHHQPRAAVAAAAEVGQLMICRAGFAEVGAQISWSIRCRWLVTPSEQTRITSPYQAP